VKLLLDENLPHELRLLLADHETITVAYMKWQGVKNGKLLELAASAGFDAILTMDRGIAFQQNIGSLPCSVVLLSAAGNAIDDLRPLVPNLLTALRALKPKSLIRVQADL
jgi:hypothetical protein